MIHMKLFVIPGMYDGILPHKLKKLTRCGESIVCLAYYSILILSSAGLFTIARGFRSTVRSAHSTHGGSISTGHDSKSSGSGGGMNTYLRGALFV